MCVGVESCDMWYQKVCSFKIFMHIQNLTVSITVLPECYLLYGTHAGSMTVEQAGPASGSATSPSSSVQVPFSGL